MKPRLFLAAFVATAALMPACTSDAEKAYARCVARNAAEMADEVDPDLPVDVAAGFREANQAIAEKACQVVKHQCETDPQGAMCQSMLEEDS